MLGAIAGAIVPIIAAMLLGFVAGWRHDENPSMAKSINMMVLRYALPLSMFVATVATPRAKLFDQGPLALIMLAGMVIPFAFAFGARYLACRDVSASALQALGFGFPALPFFGMGVLTPLIGSDAVVVVAIGGCILVVVLLPATLVLLTLGENSRRIQTTRASDGKPLVSEKKLNSRLPREPAAPGKGLLNVLTTSLLEPVVWAPLSGLALVCCGIPMPRIALNAFHYLGDTSGAVSLFASGIILQAQKPIISWPVIITTLARNLGVPGIAFLALSALGVSHELRKTAVLGLALPAAAMQITLALRFETNEQENASLLLYSTCLSIVTIYLISSLLHGA